MRSATDLLAWGLVAHVVADWLGQNAWMSDHKASLRHPAAWAHGGIHLAALLLVFPPISALVLTASHMAIDTRRPLTWWRRVFGQTTDGPMGVHVAIWSDQILHVVCIACAALLQGGQP